MKSCRKAGAALFALLLAAVLLSFVCAASENTGTPIELYINGYEVEGAVLYNGNAYAPYRVLVTAIDPMIEYSWDGKAHATTATGDGITICAAADEHYVDANGRILFSELAKNVLIDDVLYVPVRPIATAFSLSCVWHGPSRSVSLDGTPTPLESGDTYYDSAVLDWLSHIISAESRGEPFVGQIAVGNVVLNRAADGSFPDTVYEVIFDRKFGTQFTPAASGSVYRDPSESSIRAAKIALEGVSVVDNALYFCARRVSSGSWMDRNRQYIETIGNHVFYY